MRELTVGHKTRAAISKSLRTLQREALTAAAFLCRARHGRKSQEPTCDSCLAAITRDVEGLIPSALYAPPLPEIREEDVEILSQYRDELGATISGGGRLFAPRDCARFKGALTRVLEAVSARKGDAPPSERVPEEANPLAWLLRKAVLAPNEDGDVLLLFLNLWGEWEEERGLTIALANGETSEEPFTAEDTPFLTDDQRADINGTTTHAKGYIDDPPTITKALEYCASQNRRNG